MAETWLAKLNLPPSSLEILWDPKAAVVTAYNIDPMPASFIVDGQGIIRYKHEGFHSPDPAT